MTCRVLLSCSSNRVIWQGPNCLRSYFINNKTHEFFCMMNFGFLKHRGRFQILPCVLRWPILTSAKSWRLIVCHVVFHPVFRAPHALLTTECQDKLFSLISYYAVGEKNVFLRKQKLFYSTLQDICSPLKICVRACLTSLHASAETHRTVLSLISCFAGGVFLSACLLDIIPDYLSDINVELDARKLEVRLCGAKFG